MYDNVTDMNAINGSNSKNSDESSIRVCYGGMLEADSSQLMKDNEISGRSKRQRNSLMNFPMVKHCRH